MNEYVEKWRKENPDWRNKQRVYFEKWKESHPGSRQQGNSKEWRAKIKRIVLTHYANEKLECVICHENRIGCLSIDHINGGGNKHRKEIKSSGYHFYMWLIKNKFPEGYRTLCMNCQFLSTIKEIGEQKVIHCEGGETKE